MDFFESMAMSGGNPAVAAGMHSASQKKGKEIIVRTGPPPRGVKRPEGYVAVYDLNGHFVGWMPVDKIVL